MTDIVRGFFSQQVAVCRRLDRWLFKNMSIDGNEDFTRYVRDLVKPGSRIADIGGGKTPFFSADDVRMKQLVVTGVDMDGSELSSAPEGCYAATRVEPIEEARGNGDNDLVIAQSILEHVSNGELAALGIASFGRIGCSVVTFCPSRRAWFAQLNLLLPEVLKREVLFFVFPAKRERQGFPAHYDACTPKELIANMERAGVKCAELRPYFVSSYFMFFVPFYLFWRLATFPLMKLWPRAFCETFMFVGYVDAHRSGAEQRGS